MIVEKTAKAGQARNNPSIAPAPSHATVKRFFKVLHADRMLRRRLGYQKSSEWDAAIRRLVRIADTVERFAPALAGQAKNVEYPWATPDGSVSAPANDRFSELNWLDEVELARFVGSVLNTYSGEI
ncbi:hypothetical protein [Fimbriimonas ginsengisoli]|uniref:Uncharacterized protein n=1 Tax=Fimbriimonas ginsengisoli Gsoil 348 TaxID=661478 RepID=A0A068NS88_FIMGI|nr:hypothetical protein [Fimbriimonas ginsengisoli]AIE86212.1 hypothetical protein OP10G_2844 [Fimbriimonas ginsengisoli Gsoil 348]